MIRKMGDNIKKNRKKVRAAPLISICCVTYNHKPYIRDAIEGFLMQKTNSPFEIIIHDDASTDGTTDIVKEYAKKHPDLIVSILQKENQYSKGIKIASTYVFPKAKGKYIALCEGDDYWTDPLKLQKQIDFMEKHSECQNSFHPVIKIDSYSGEEIGINGQIYDKERIISAKEILNRKIAFMPTCSLMVRSDFFRNSANKKFLLNHGSSFFLKFLPSIEGGSLYINEVMASYRVASLGSYTSRSKKSFSFAINSSVKLHKAYDAANQLTGGFYQNEIQGMKVQNIFNILGRTDIPPKKRREYFKKYKYELSLKQKLFVLVKFSWLGCKKRELQKFIKGKIK